MIKYMGSKARHGKEILDAILDDLDCIKTDISIAYDWVEPFVGGGNMIEKTIGVFKNRIGFEINGHVVELLKATRDGWQPPINISEEEYLRCRAIKNSTPDKHIGFVGIAASYAGRWFEGYARGKNKNGTRRNYVEESSKQLIKSARLIAGCEFYQSDYRDINILSPSIIYCDPPYSGAKQYGKQFNKDEFVSWAIQKKNDGHKVYVSEYEMPNNFTPIWEKQCPSSLTKNKGAKTAVERLFVLK